MAIIHDEIDNTLNVIYDYELDAFKVDSDHDGVYIDFLNEFSADMTILEMYTPIEILNLIMALCIDFQVEISRLNNGNYYIKIETK